MRIPCMSWLLISAASLFFQNLPLAAQQAPEVSASLLGKRIAVGEQGTLMIQVLDGEKVLPPVVQVAGLKITYADKSFEFENRSKHVFYYHLAGETPGTFTIPAIPVQVDGQEFSTLPLEVTIFAPEPGNAAAAARLPRFLRLEVPQQELWVGQLVPLTLTVFSRGRQSIIEASGPTLKHDAFVINRFKTVNFDGL